ncbi:MAG: phosphate ABC transporter permease PstA [Pygmaiobacter sp.]|nr:phosphate ABC transporter permease PstA [Pygmaiobacter sp.]
MRAIIWLCAGLATLLVVLLIGYILFRGVPSITWELLTSQESYLKNTIGILPSILNTLYIIVAALAIVLPLGVGAAVYLTEYAKNPRLVRAIEFTTETLAGIPSIIYGLVGMMFFCQLLGLGTSLLAGALTLVIMILPTIVRTTQESLKTVPENYREGALGLGATKWTMIRTIILPCSIDGIVTGCILAIGRIVGESAALLFTAGLGLKLLGGFFSAMGGSGATLSVALYVYAMERGKFDIAFAVAAVLMVIVLIVNFAAKMLARRLKKRS